VGFEGAAERIQHQGIRADGQVTIASALLKAQLSASVSVAIVGALRLDVIGVVTADENRRGCARDVVRPEKRGATAQASRRGASAHGQRRRNGLSAASGARSRRWRGAVWRVLQSESWNTAVARNHRSPERQTIENGPVRLVGGSSAS
jgi:hypothetical protein